MAASLSVSDPSLSFSPFWARRVVGYLTTRDGLRLRYSALLPAERGRFPALVNYSGYDPGALGGAAYCMYRTTMSADLDRSLIAAGYAVVGVNARGTGCSEGQIEFLGRHYGEDGYDAIEFIAKQDWCDGAVGMANWSWAGMSQLATASERPPSLKAIAPGTTMGDPRLDNFAPGGIPAPEFATDWWAYLHDQWESVKISCEHDGDAEGLAQLARNFETSELNHLPSLLLRHPLRDEFIESYNLAARTHQIEVPVFAVAAFQDDALLAREGYYQETIKPGLLWQVHMNGPHDIYVAQKLRPQLIAFFDRFVKGRANGFEKTPRVQVWIECTASGPEASQYGNLDSLLPGIEFTSSEYPLPIKETSFALHTGGRLLMSGVSGGQPDHFEYPRPSAPVNHLSDGSAIWGELSADWRKGCVLYTSAPLDDDLVLYGPASANLFLSITRTDADIQVTLTEVRSDGQETFVQRGWLRLSNRMMDQARSTPTRPMPVDRPEAVKAMRPDVPELARVELPPFAHAFRKGSSVRLWIEAPSQYGDYRLIHNPVETTVSVWHDEQHPSSLVVGRVEGVEVPEAYPSGVLLMQPCRPDPVR